MSETTAEYRVKNERADTAQGINPTLYLEIRTNFGNIEIDIVKAFTDLDEANQVLKSLKSTILSELDLDALEK